MKDLFGNKKPVQIETNEWWFNGWIIVKQEDFRLPNWISFLDSKNSDVTMVHMSKVEAVKYALENPFLNPDTHPENYIH